MRYIYLLGAPKSGKTQVAKKLASINPNSRVVDVPTKAQSNQINFPLGNLIDYRVETYLGLQRALETLPSFPKNKDIETLIVVNSPITNLAHAASIVTNIVEYTEPEEVEIEQWGYALNFLTRLIQDTVWDDKFFFLEGNDKTDFGIQLETTIKKIIQNIGIDYHTLSGKVLQKYEKAATLLSNE